MDVTGAVNSNQLANLFITRTDAVPIVFEMRNATAGGTLLATFGGTTGTTTGRFQFVYGTIAAGFAANAWVAQGFQIPATT